MLKSCFDGVSQVETVYATGIATIVYDDASVTPEELQNALFEFGYDAEMAAPEDFDLGAQGPVDLGSYDRLVIHPRRGR